MPRLNTSDELWVAVSSAGFVTDETAGTPGSTTSDAVYSAGDTVLSVVSETNFATGDLVRLATGSSMEIAIVESTAAGSLTMESGIAFAHASGIVLVEQQRVDLGDISDDGVTRESSVERTEIRAATQAGTYATLVTNANARLGWNLLNHSLENVMFALGIDESNITGAGTAADPYISDINPDNFNELTNIAIYFAGSLRDGTTVEVQGWNCDFDPNATISYLRGQAVSIPFAADVQHIRYLMPSQV
jgi:hypothetical protein